MNLEDAAEQACHTAINRAARRLLLFREWWRDNQRVLMQWPQATARDVGEPELRRQLALVHEGQRRLGDVRAVANRVHSDVEQTCNQMSGLWKVRDESEEMLDLCAALDECETHLERAVEQLEAGLRLLLEKEATP